VHFRSAPDHEQALQSILPVVQTLPEARVICGAAAVNLLPRDGANKGVALQRAMAASGCDLAIYAGDDETDEDAFTAIRGEALLSIHIGASDDSGARYHLESQAEIDTLLQTLIDARADRRV
jgi:trehalose 6-phosphate phosphatase